MTGSDPSEGPEQYEDLVRRLRDLDETNKTGGATPEELRHQYEELTKSIVNGVGSTQRDDGPLLPYRSRHAWIAKGPTKLSWSELGEVSIADGELTLEVAEARLACCSVEDITVHRVPIWFGMGVRLDMRDAGRWYVQPRYSATGIRRGRRATRIFKQALAEAQEQVHPARW